MYEEGKDSEQLWDIFKSSLQEEIHRFIPSKSSNRSRAPPWLNRKLRKMIRRKTRLHRQARKTGNWSNFRQAQKECKKAFRQAEWTYINEVIQKGLDNNTKSFWRYVKSKNQDNIGVSPLCSRGQLQSDGQSKAEVLVNQFSSIFTRDDDTNLPPVRIHVCDSIQDIVISEAGVAKLLLNIQTAKAPGPDGISNLVLKECATELIRWTMILSVQVDIFKINVA